MFQISSRIIVTNFEIKFYYQSIRVISMTSRYVVVCFSRIVEHSYWWNNNALYYAKYYSSIISCCTVYMLYVCLRTTHIHTHRGTYTTLFTVYTSLLCTCIMHTCIMHYAHTILHTKNTYFCINIHRWNGKPWSQRILYIFYSVPWLQYDEILATHSGKV